MFERLRQLIEEMTGSQAGERDFGEDEMRVAAAALLVHVAEIDGFFGGSEKRALLLLLQQRFDLGLDEAESCSPKPASATARRWTSMVSPPF